MDIEEVIREIPALVGSLRPLITYDKGTMRDGETLQRLGCSLLAFSTGGASSRGNRTDGCAMVRTQAFQRRTRRAESEAHQELLQVQDLRRVYEDLRAERDAMRAGSSNGMRRGYLNGPGGFTSSHFGVPPPYHRRHHDTNSDSYGFAA